MSNAPLTYVEKFHRHLVRALMRLPEGIQSRLAGPKPIESDGSTLHPELRLLLKLRELAGSRRLCDLPPKITRRQLARERLIHCAKPIPVGQVRDFVIPGTSSHPSIPVRHYVPGELGDKAPPLLVFLHGGGFVLCDLDSHDEACRFLCSQVGIQILAVDYRLAPEFPFPAALEDAETAFSWAVRHAESLGADPKRVMIGGDSAGGNLAAALAHQCRETGGEVPFLQFLIYPAVDRTTEYESLTRFGSGFLLTRADIDWFTQQYAQGVDPSDPRCYPLFAKDLSGLAPALVVTAGFDPLRDEGEAYARHLQSAGTRCELIRSPRMLHGFINLIGVSPACRSALGQVADRLKSQIHQL